MKTLDRIISNLLLFCFGGFVYYLIEVIYRGHSHWSMYILGGLCFLVMGSVNKVLPWSMGLIQQVLIAALATTVMEFIAGLILNVWWRWGIWDYSNTPFNLLGQVCLYFYFIWCALSLVGILLIDFIRWRIYNEEKPHYTVV